MSDENNLKGNFFEVIYPPVECPDCKHPRRAIGAHRICGFCKKQEKGKIIVCGEIVQDDHISYFEASEKILAHIQHAKSMATLRNNHGIRIHQSLAFNHIAAKADTALKFTKELYDKLDQISKNLEHK